MWTLRSGCGHGSKQVMKGYLARQLHVMLVIGLLQIPFFFALSIVWSNLLRSHGNPDFRARAYPASLIIMTVIDPV